MGVSSSLFAGISGLNANANAMSVIGNNIANANTVGFKSSRSIFSDMLSSQIAGSGGTSQIGRGASLSIVDNIFSQGSMENTEVDTDLAVEGAGMFILSDAQTQNTVNYYSRAGAFRFDANGYLVNPEGMNVMGYQVDANGNTYGDLVPIYANTQSFTAAGPTANITLTTNIDSDSTAIPAGFDVLNPTTSSHYATSIRVFDSLGSTHLMTTYFTKTANQSWEWNTVVDGGEVNGGTAGTLELVGSGVLNFDTSGNLDLATSGNGIPLATPGVFTTTAGALDWLNGAVQTQQITLNMNPTQYASPSVVVSQEQDGYGTGALVKLTINDQGVVTGNFSNGTPRKLMQIALARFNNPTELTKLGNNMWAESRGSGPATVGTVGSGIGNIYTNSLEMSNVDLAQEFVKMITTQRGFSANSKTITTTDEMLAEVLNLKR